jgi:hypothetical protein
MSFFFFLGPTWRLGTDEFKQNCREMITRISQQDETILIIDSDKPLAQITRYEEPPLAGYGSLKGKVEILGDIEGPMPVEWYTHPDVRTDEDWRIDGPMPASWFDDPHRDNPTEFRIPDQVDVSLLNRHDFFTVNIGEFVAQLDEIIVAVSESKDGVVAVFDDEKGLVQMTRYERKPGVNSLPLIREGSGS